MESLALAAAALKADMMVEVEASRLPAMQSTADPATFRGCFERPRLHEPHECITHAGMLLHLRS